MNIKMKIRKNLMIFIGLFSLSSFAIQAQTILVSVPSAKIRSAAVDDCNNPYLVLTQGSATLGYEVDPQLDCEFVQKALFFAGASDDIAGELIRVNLTFDKPTLTLIRVSIHQGNNVIETVTDMERLLAKR